MLIQLGTKCRVNKCQKTMKNKPINCCLCNTEPKISSSSECGAVIAGLYIIFCPNCNLQTPCFEKAQLAVDFWNQLQKEIFSG